MKNLITSLMVAALMVAPIGCDSEPESGGSTGGMPSSAASKDAPADVDPETGLMRVDDLRDAFGRAEGSSVKAVFPVHLAGQAAEMEEISCAAREFGLKIVEDGCHALGTGSD